MLILSSLIFSLIFSFNIKDTPFFKRSIDRIYLNKIKVKDIEDKALSFEESSRKRYKLSLNKDYKNLYSKLTEEQKKIFIKLASFKILPDFKKFKKPYTYIVKNGDNTFYVETFIVINKKFKDIEDTVKDFKNYNLWTLKNINTRKNPSDRRYFLLVKSFDFLQKKEFFSSRINLKTSISGNYKIDFKLIKNLDDFIPSFYLYLEEPTKLAKSAKGEFFFFPVPKKDKTIIYFKGHAKVYWLIYTFLPIGIVETEVGERIETIMKNFKSFTNKKEKEEKLKKEKNIKKLTKSNLQD
jgi:hypothetical protein